MTQTQSNQNDLRARWGDSLSPDQNPCSTLKPDAYGLFEETNLVIGQRRFGALDDSGETEKDFALGEMLGEGGMGMVFNARQTSIGRDVAIKMIKPEKADDKFLKNKFLREAITIGELDHPNVVPIHDLCEIEDGSLFYVMKEMKGASWNEVLAEKSQSENLEILRRICDAVAFAHSKGIIHRDIKPENVMLGDFGEVMLGDWGLALNLKYLDSEIEGKESGPVGTSVYMAPEMAKCDFQAIGFASDIYLLGATLYEIITGNPPHEGKNIYECLHSAAENIIDTGDYVGELMEIAMRAMATVPEERYASVKEFQEALKKFQHHQQAELLFNQARKNLDNARLSGDYDDYSQALFAVRETLKLWPQNKEADAFFVNASVSYAKRALERDDFDLAKSLIKPSWSEATELSNEIDSAMLKRQCRRKAIRGLSIGTYTLVLILFVTVLIGLIFVQREKINVEMQRDQAVEARIKTQESLTREKKLKNEAINNDREKQKLLVKYEAEKKKALAAESEAQKKAEESREAQLAAEEALERMRSAVRAEKIAKMETIETKKKAEISEKKLSTQIDNERYDKQIKSALINIAENKIDLAKTSLTNIQDPPDKRLKILKDYCQATPIWTRNSGLDSIERSFLSSNGEKLYVVGRVTNHSDEALKKRLLPGRVLAMFENKQIPNKNWCETICVDLAKSEIIARYPGRLLYIDDSGGKYISLEAQADNDKLGIFLSKLVGRKKRLERQKLVELIYKNIHKTLLASSLGRYLAWSFPGKKSILLYNVEQKSEIILRHKTDVTRVEFSPDERFIYALGSKIKSRKKNSWIGYLCKWNLSKYRKVDTQEIKNCRLSEDAVYSSRLNLLVTKSPNKNKYHLWDLAVNKIRMAFDKTCEPLKFSPTNNFLYSRVSIDEISAIDVNTGEKLKTFKDCAGVLDIVEDDSIMIGISSENNIALSVWRFLLDREKILKLNAKN